MLDIHHYISFKYTIENGHRMVARHKHSSLSFVMSCASATTSCDFIYIKLFPLYMRIQRRQQKNDKAELLRTEYNQKVKGVTY